MTRETKKAEFEKLMGIIRKNRKFNRSNSEIMSYTYYRKLDESQLLDDRSSQFSRSINHSFRDIFELMSSSSDVSPMNREKYRAKLKELEQSLPQNIQRSISHYL